MIISPHEEVHFSREGVVDINAAVVGISQTRWKYIEESDATDEQAKTIMHQQRFDVLPIVNNTVVKKYFHTKKWSDYSEISLKTITHKEVIPFDINIRDVIKGFVLDSRNFYFLHNERRIVGLISVVNLNCRQVKVYLFSLLSELEVCLGKFITTHVSGDELWRMTFGKEEKEKHKDVKKRYQEAKNTGIDAPFVEYLYLTDLIDISEKISCMSNWDTAVRHILLDVWVR